MAGFEKKSFEVEIIR